MNDQADQRIGGVAMVIVDVQGPYLWRKLGLEKTADLIRNINEAVSRLNLPIVLLEMRDKGRTVKSIREACAPDAIVISKGFASGFCETNLAETLRARGVNTILLAGVNASVCVWQTGIYGRIEGFRVVTAKNLVGDPDGEGIDFGKMFSAFHRFYEDWRELLR